MKALALRNCNSGGEFDLTKNANYGDFVVQIQFTHRP
jgi:hypothetical protein